MIIKNCNVNKLHDEFMQAGIYPYPVFDLGNGEGDFTFPEGTDPDNNATKRQVIKCRHFYS